MKRSVPAASPDAYVAALTGWRRACVEELRTTVLGAARLDEVVKWGNLVYVANGPVLMIRAGPPWSCGMGGPSRRRRCNA